MTPDAAAALLGVAPDATHEQVESAYRARARESHPDRASGDAALFMRVTEARGVLLGQPVAAAPMPAPISRWSWPLFWAWIGVIAVAVFVSIFRAPEPLGPVEPVVRYTLLGGSLIAYALTGLRQWFWIAVIAIVWTAGVTLVFTSLGPLVGLLLLVAPIYGLTLLGRATAARAATRSPRD